MSGFVSPRRQSGVLPAVPGAAQEATVVESARIAPVPAGETVSCVRCLHSGALVCALDHCGLCYAETMVEIEAITGCQPTEAAMELVARMIQEEGHE